MNEKYKRAFNHGVEVMNKFSCDTPEYELGRKLVAWSCENNRAEQKVKTFFPAIVGSMEEKLEHEAWVQFNEDYKNK